MKEPQEMNIPQEPVFSEERYEYFRKAGLTEDEIRILENAEAAANVTDVLPESEDGLQSVFDKIEALPENTALALDELHKMAEEDPDSYAQIFALVEAADMAHEENVSEK